MADLTPQLEIDSCPHCGRVDPTIVSQVEPFETKSNDEVIIRWWCIYVCNSCGGVIVAGSFKEGEYPRRHKVEEIYPAVPIIDELIPETPREYLQQAQNTLHAPSGCIMLSASAVDAMLKEKAYTDGSLYERIDKAADDHLITEDMAKWAHQIRLDANAQRHTDEGASLPDGKDAKLTFEFAVSFAEYLFVLPSRVTRGITASVPNS